MRKFCIVVSMVFLLGIAAEWIMLSGPSTGVVLGMKYRHATNDYTLDIITSNGTLMTVNMPEPVWKAWFRTVPVGKYTVTEE